MTTGQAGGAAVQLWHTLVGAIVEGETTRARRLVTPGFEWQVMGRSPQAGKYLGVEGLAELFHKVQEASEKTFHLETEVAVGDDAAAAMVGRVTASRAGRTLDTRNVFVLQCENGLVARGWTIPMDQYEFDDFWR